jgi:hypothetical protein
MLRRLHGGQPVDDAAEKGEQQRLEGADARRHQRHQQQVRPQAFRAGPEKRQQLFRPGFDGVVRVRRDEAFEVGEQIRVQAVIEGPQG